MNQTVCLVNQTVCLVNRTVFGESDGPVSAINTLINVESVFSELSCSVPSCRELAI